MVSCILLITEKTHSGSRVRGLRKSSKILLVTITMEREYVQSNIVRLSVCAFIVIYMFLISSRSSYLYDPDGALREFGIGRTGKTVVPAWLVAVLLAITIYFAASMYSSGVSLLY